MQKEPKGYETMSISGDLWFTDLKTSGVQTVKHSCYLKLTRNFQQQVSWNKTNSS